MIDTTSLAQQLRERLQQEPIVFVDASLDEYWTVLDELGEEPFPLEYDIDYINGQIRAKNRMASEKHETIVSNLSRVLGNLFYNDSNLRVMSSNVLVYVPPCALTVNPDVLVVKGESQLFIRPQKAPAITNPYILVEIKSDSTEKHDMATKLRCYKQLESVYCILYIDQHQPYVTVYTKNGDNHHWFNDDYDQLIMNVQLGDVTIPMNDIYHKVNLTA